MYVFIYLVCTIARKTMDDVNWGCPSLFLKRDRPVGFCSDPYPADLVAVEQAEWGSLQLVLDGKYYRRVVRQEQGWTALV